MNETLSRLVMMLEVVDNLAERLLSDIRSRFPDVEATYDETYLTYERDDCEPTREVKCRFTFSTTKSSTYSSYTDLSWKDNDQDHLHVTLSNGCNDEVLRLSSSSVFEELCAVVGKRVERLVRSD